MNRQQALLPTLLLVAASLSSASRAWEVDPDLLSTCPILQTAIDRATEIAESPLGVDCYINGPLDTGQDPAAFTRPDNGPEIRISNDRPGANGWYFPQGPGGALRNVIFINEQVKLDAADGDAAAFEVLISTILHETAHWVDNVVDGADTFGEEGDQMEEWLFGIDVERENATGSVNGACSVVPPGTLGLDIEALRPIYLVGEGVELLVTLSNQSSAPVSVLDSFELEGNYLSLDITHEDSGEHIGYSGIEVDLILGAEMVVDLLPGETIKRRVLVNRTGEGYVLDRPGSYRVDAIYQVPNYGCPIFGRQLYRGRESTTSPIVLTLVDTDIPALDTWGLLLAVLALMAAGVLVLRRGHQASGDGIRPRRSVARI